MVVDDPVTAGTDVTDTVMIRDEDDALTDPVALVCKYRFGDGTESDFTYGVGLAITRESLGVYSIVVPTGSGGGVFYVKWEATTPTVEREDLFVVEGTVLS